MDCIASNICDIQGGRGMNINSFSIVMDCRGCGITINTDRPPYCYDCWCVFDEGEEE